MNLKFKVDHDYHIHSNLSSCANDPNQTPERILQYAKDNNLSSICITDHYWDSEKQGAPKWYAEQNFEHISKSLPLPQSDGIKFMFGCENEIDKNFELGMPVSRFDDFDFVLIPTTHLHFNNFTIPAELFKNPSVKHTLWIRRLDALFDMPLPFKKIGIAHIVCSLMHKFDRAEYLSILDAIPQDELERVFCRAAELGCGIELNSHDFRFTESEADTVLRIFKTAKNCGCKFFLGSDAHEVCDYEESVPYFYRAVDLLDLRESDKFHIPQ